MPLVGRVPLPPHEATDEPALAGCCQQRGDAASRNPNQLRTSRLENVMRATITRAKMATKQPIR